MSCKVLKTKLSIASLGLLSFSALPFSFGCSHQHDVAPAPDVVWIAPAEAAFPPPSNPESNPESKIEERKAPFIPDAKAQLSIAELLDIALRNNPRTKHAWAVAKGAAYSLGAAESPWLPTVNGTGSLNLNKGTNKGSSASSTNHSDYQPSAAGTLTATYLLLDFGGRSASVEAAQQALYAANWMHNQTIQDVMLAVFDAYYQFIKVKASLEAKEIDLKDAQTSFDAANELYKAGVGRRVDTLQAQATLASTHLDIETLHGQQKIALSALVTALGLPTGSTIHAEDLPDVLPLQTVNENIDQLLEKAFVTKPDYAAAYATLQVRKAGLAVAESSALPTLTANASASRTAYLSRSGTDFNNYGAGVSLNFPIFQGSLSEDQKGLARSLLEEAKADLAAKEAQIALNVLTNYYAYETAQGTLKYAEEYLGYAQEAYDIASGIYKNGVGSILDLLNAQAMLANARFQRIQARVGWASSLSSLAYATGSLSIPSNTEVVKEGG